MNVSIMHCRHMNRKETKKFYKPLPGAQENMGVGKIRKG